MGATKWKSTIWLSATALPFSITIVFAIVDAIDYFEKSNQYFPFTAVMIYALLYIVISVSSSYLGAYRGYTDIGLSTPCKISTVRRAIPSQQFYHNPLFTSLMSGAVIFSTFVFEFHYILDSVWHSYLIVMFCTLLVNILLLIIVVGLLSILNTYMCLQAQNWHWWWKAYLNGASSGFFMFYYCVYTMICVNKMELIWSDIVYMVYSL